MQGCRNNERCPMQERYNLYLQSCPERLLLQIYNKIIKITPNLGVKYDKSERCNIARGFVDIRYG